MSGSLPRALALVLVAALPAALGACNTAKPAPQQGARMSMIVQGSPATVMQGLKAEASSRGGTVVQETANTMIVDFGTAERRIPVPTEYGLWGTRVSFRDTEVHATAHYWVEPSKNGTRVTVFNNPIYWHPDYKSWLPGPYDVAPGFDALTASAGVQ